MWRTFAKKKYNELENTSSKARSTIQRVSKKMMKFQKHRKLIQMLQVRLRLLLLLILQTTNIIVI